MASVLPSRHLISGYKWNNCTDCYRIFRVAEIDGNKLLSITESDLKTLNCPSKKIKEIMKFVKAVRVPKANRFVGKSANPPVPVRSYVAVPTPSPITNQDDSDDDAEWSDTEFDPVSEEDDDDDTSKPFPHTVSVPEGVSDRSNESPAGINMQEPVPSPRMGRGRLPNPVTMTPPVPQRRRPPPPLPEDSLSGQDDYEKPVIPAMPGAPDPDQDYEEPDQELRPRPPIATPTKNYEEGDENYTNPDQLKVQVQKTHGGPLPLLPGAAIRHIPPTRTEPLPIPPIRNEPRPTQPRNTHPVLPMPPRNVPNMNTSAFPQKAHVAEPAVTFVNDHQEPELVYEEPDPPPTRLAAPSPTSILAQGPTIPIPAVPRRRGIQELAVSEDEYLVMGEGLGVDIHTPNMEEENYEVPEEMGVHGTEAVGIRASVTAAYTTGDVSRSIPAKTLPKYIPSKQEVFKQEPPPPDVPKPRGTGKKDSQVQNRHLQAKTLPLTPTLSGDVSRSTQAKTPQKYIPSKQEVVKQEPPPPDVPKPRDPKPKDQKKIETAPKRQVESNLSCQPWFHGDQSRKDVDANLLARQMDGMYCIRNSTHPNQPFTLAIYYGDRVFNLPVRERTDGKYAIGAEKPGEHTFASLVEMVNFFKKNFLVLPGNKQTNLIKSLPKR